jgi:CO/xanthine dehydrogenase Mo-binding subunit
MSAMRIDGLAKVRGEKVYARDLRSLDMRARGVTDWPLELRHALILRATQSHALFQGLKLDELPCQPAAVVTAEQLAEAGFTQPVDMKPRWDPFGDYWLVPRGRATDHVGQPLAILYYDDIQSLRDTMAWLLSGKSPALLEPLDGSPPETDIRRLDAPLLAMVEREELSRYGSSHHIRLAGEAADEFSEVKNGKHNPFQIREDPHAPPDKERKRLEANRGARGAWQRIDDAIIEQGWEVLDRTFYTPTHDPLFMEPEAGLGWWNPAGNTLHLVVGTQSPAKDVQNVRKMLGLPGSIPKKKGEGELDIQVHPCFPGGGFGGRDDSSFTPLLALAARFSGGRPVRLAYDRYEQFLAGIKRHASVVRNRLAYDEKGTLQALVSTTVMDGGGQANLTNPVVGLAVLHAAGPYRIPRTVLNGFGIKTPGAPAGSLRGFGIPQVAFALETMVDEVAARITARTGKDVDAIALRKRQALQRGDRDVTGMVLEHHLANEKLCDLALEEPLWQRRHEEKQRRDRPGLLYGVGFAMCMQAYGTTSDAALAEVSLDARGHISVASSAVDMGQGAATALAITTQELLGQPAHHVDMAQVHPRFTDLLRPIDQALSDKGVEEERKSKLVNAMSASMTVFHKVHAVQEACRVLWDHALAPAAEALTGARDIQPRWEDGVLVVGEHRLTLETLARKAHELRLVVSAQVHTFFQHRFASGTYTVGGRTRERDVDALAVRFGDAGEYEHIPGANLSYPGKDLRRSRRTLYASAGHLLAVEVHVNSGVIRVVDAVTLLDAGKVHHLELLQGQVEGGLAMGIGMALLEELPPSPEGTDGRWNLHRYEIPRARHVPLRSMQLRLVPFPDEENILPGGTPSRLRKKGIAEAVMSTVAPAVANAVAHATGGLRMNRVPITPARMREALAQR